MLPQGCRFGPESSRQTLVSPICRSLRNHLWRIVSENVEGTNLQPRPPPPKKKKKKSTGIAQKHIFHSTAFSLPGPSISFGGPSPFLVAGFGQSAAQRFQTSEFLLGGFQLWNDLLLSRQDLRLITGSFKPPIGSCR